MYQSVYSQFVNYISFSLTDREGSQKSIVFFHTRGEGSESCFLAKYFFSKLLYFSHHGIINAETLTDIELLLPIIHQSFNRHRPPSPRWLMINRFSDTVWRLIEDWWLMIQWHSVCRCVSLAHSVSHNVTQCECDKVVCRLIDDWWFSDTVCGAAEEKPGNVNDTVVEGTFAW